MRHACTSLRLHPVWGQSPRQRSDRALGRRRLGEEGSQSLARMPCASTARASTPRALPLPALQNARSASSTTRWHSTHIMRGRRSHPSINFVQLLINTPSPTHHPPPTTQVPPQAKTKPARPRTPAHGFESI